ncbi:MAG: hypothetical protein NWS46_11030, partial [Cyclobacteriaceae bacterium]|nr:hypothetical protein [Cyclobacteriaceae bacterium]
IRITILTKTGCLFVQELNTASNILVGSFYGDNTLNRYAQLDYNEPVGGPKTDWYFGKFTV